MTGWLGFYGPAFTELLRADSGATTWDDAWSRAVALHESNPPDERHWEFLATGYLHLTDHAARLDASVARRLIRIEERFQSAPRTNNWRLMQAVVRSRLAGRRLRTADLASAGIVAAADGYLPDGDADDPSTQYHAYILLLAMRFGELGDATLARVIASGVEWLVSADSRCGDPSALGRGRFQLFGYAAMAAVAQLAPTWGISVTPEWKQRVERRVLEGTRDGTLAACWTGPHRSLLLHGYNTVSDYARFTELWSREAFKTASSEVRTEDNGPEAYRFWWHPVGDGRSGIVGTRHGAVAALVAREEARRPSRREALRTVCASLRREMPAAPVELTSQPLSVGGFDVSFRASRVVLVSRTPMLGRDRELRLPVFWIRHSVRPKLDHAGCVESEEFTWNRTGAAPWSGVGFRLVREGKVEIECGL